MTSPPYGSALRLALDLVAPVLHRAAAVMWRPAGLSQRYPAYLHAMHGVVRASVPLMEAAVLRCAHPEPGDRIARMLRGYLEEHVAEERDHDDWLLDDLAAAGAQPALLRATQPAPLVAAMVGAQYYWIHHHHPVCLLGYIAALEANAPSPYLADELEQRTGLPSAAFRTVRYHAAADVGHSHAVLALVDRLRLTAAQARAVNVSALSTVDRLAELWTYLGAHP
jgi:pyrroloquinoline quinone (PQQ) biosynthesis protein C